MNGRNHKLLGGVMRVALIGLGLVQLASAQIATVTASIPFIAFGGTTAPGT